MVLHPELIKQLDLLDSLLDKVDAVAQQLERQLKKDGKMVIWTNKVHELRIDRKMTLGQLGEATGYPRSTVFLMLRPQFAPKRFRVSHLLFIARVARALNTPLHTLLFDSPKHEQMSLFDD